MWKEYYNTSSLKLIRKKLRNNSTKYEIKMWEYLKWKKFL